jgi:two-component sensor histidine kinase/multisubunit Na+/H+ antiporter MnhB subunit
MKIFLILIFTYLTLYSQALISKVSYYEDKNNNLQVKDIKNKEFITFENNFIHNGYSESTFWLKVEVKNTTNTNIQQTFVLSNFALDEIIFYAKNHIYLAGNENKENDNFLQNFYFDFPLNNLKKSTNIYFIKIKSKNPISINYKIVDTFNNYNSTIIHIVLSALFFAFLLAIIIYNVFLYFILKDKIYVYYLFFQISFFLLLIAINGFGYHFIWRNNVDINVFILRYVDDLFLVFSLLFHYKFLNLKRYKNLSKVIFFFIFLLFIGIFIRYFISPVFSRIVLIAVIILLVYIVYHAYKNEAQIEKYYLFAWTLILFSGLIVLARNFAFLPSNLFTDWSLYIASMIEAILFSSSLVSKINTNELKYKKILKYEVTKQTASLNEALVQKELLLSEIHHRVKNNLQIVSSFISLANIKNNTTNNQEEIFISLQNRISSISLLHEYLYKNHDLSKINIDEYIHSLVEQVLQVYSADNIICKYEIQNIKLDFDQIIILGVIINEIVTNSIKHAFKNTKNPTIKIKVLKIDNKHIFEISDNGCGFSNSILNKSMGLRLINRLISKQLNAKLKFQSDLDKTTFLIEF